MASLEVVIKIFDPPAIPKSLFLLVNPKHE